MLSLREYLEREGIGFALGALAELGVEQVGDLNELSADDIQDLGARPSHLSEKERGGGTAGPTSAAQLWGGAALWRGTRSWGCVAASAWSCILSRGRPVARGPRLWVPPVGRPG